MPDTLLSIQPLWYQAGRSRKFVQLAGLFGALAVIFAAVGAHGADMHGKRDAYNSAVQIHFFHTLALFAVPFVRRPDLVSKSADWAQPKIVFIDSFEGYANSVNFRIIFANF